MERSLKLQLVLSLVVLVLGLCRCRSGPTGNECESVLGRPSCVCKHPDGIIDLTPLALYNGSARFTNVIDKNAFVYSYNPCYTFSPSAECKDGYICQKYGHSTYLLAESGTEKIYYDSEIFVYYSSYANKYREAYVKLVCNQTITTGQEYLTTTGESERQLEYRFALYSCHACPGGCWKRLTRHMG